MPRKKNEARRPPLVLKEMPLMVIERPLYVPIDTSKEYRDAEENGSFLVPLEIEVEQITSYSDALMLMELPLYVPIDTSKEYRDAVNTGSFHVPLEIEVEQITSYGDAFRPLSKEEEQTIKGHFSKDESNILVAHTDSNITITGKILSCLKPRGWLNDEVINLYITLLKEREIREPENHPKCHFFNTFFFSKLVNLRTEYKYDAVKKWTSIKKLGYYLKDCDKIFVPIPMDLHWSLVVINIEEQKFQYLDSLKGYHSSEYIIEAVARYFVDEVNDKNQVDIDVSQWTYEFVQNLPVQGNVFDCGMFMLKYIDFYNKGMDLSFSQEEISYFRLRTASEILQLKAE